MVGCCFRNVKKVEESIALKELRLNTLRFTQRLICRDGEKGENHSSLSIRVVQRVVGDCVNREESTVRVKLVGEFVSNSNIVAL
ncbi:hypothetical protein Tco_1454143 [Tanacetum coccineum]